MPPPTDTDGRLATIRALLAKAEATTFAAEAEAFTAKASELMARYAVDEAMLWAGSRDTSGTPTEIRLVLHRPFTAQKAVLVNAVANAYGCQALRLGRADDGATEHMSVIGFASDLSLVETLVTSLFLQLTSAMTAPLPGPAGRPASQVAAWRRSFIMGFTATITERLRADRARATAETDRERHPEAGEQSAAVVLRDRSAAVDDEFRQRYPRIRTSRVSSGTSESGRRAGTSAGRTADLGARRIGHRQALGQGN
ncbi:MAG TPA: DUF2786 domain-containing protein [Microthrixaceae bacterium]|jgi:hypothetical protein|nr:DUF2786 domain-containing protein [Microthrixaceae bacterium]